VKRGLDIFLEHALELGCDRGAHQIEVLTGKNGFIV